MSLKIIEKIRKIISSNLYEKELFCIPQAGCAVDEIKEAEEILGIKFSNDYKELLMHWNGLNLEIIRFFCCIATEDSIPSLFHYQDELSRKKFLIFASDPSGFLYAEDLKSGKILCLDTDGVNIEEIAINLEDFICNLIFGERAREFAGEAWEQELIEAGILEKRFH